VQDRVSSSVARSRVAVIGGGIAGISAAHYLQKVCDVTLYEASPQLGGHAYPVEISEDETTFFVDTAFMVFNRRSYPLFMRLLGDLGIESEVQFAEMSFSIFHESNKMGFALNRGLQGLFHQKRNIFRLSFYFQLVELFRFRNAVFRDLVEGLLSGSLREYLGSYSSGFIDNLLLPIATAVWSIPADQVLDLPVETLARFLMNHGYLRGHPGHQWRTLRGSSYTYLKAFEKNFKGTVRLNSKVAALIRTPNGIHVLSKNETFYDDVVLAVPGDQALRLIGSPTEDETTLLSNWKYTKTKLTLHKDASVLRTPRKLWSSWNILNKERGALSVTYYLNRVQDLKVKRDYFVTLGAGLTIDPAQIVFQKEFSHPVFTSSSVSTQKRLAEINGANRTYFCGSYLGFGFHEDAVFSAIEVAKLFGAPC